jgi:acetyl esterase/lipase
MKKTLVAMSIVLFFSAGPGVDGQQKPAFATYREMRAHLGQLFEQKKYAEAASLLESVLDLFPENVPANTFNLAAARAYLGEADKAVAALEEGHRRGVFYGTWDFGAELWAPVKGSPRFDAFWKTNEARIAEASRRATVKIEVETPAGYDPARTYPLFIALHGGGESIAELKPLWTSDRLRGEFLTAFVQSTQVASLKGFHWQDETITLRDLEEAYRRILRQYPVDSGRVIIGGFSSGGFGTFVAAFRNIFPIRGFFALCPAVPEAVRDEDVKAAVGRGLRGTILTTELDQRTDAQRAFAERLKGLGFPVEFHIAPNIGHWFPEDFGARLDRAIGLILPDAPAPRR